MFGRKDKPSKPQKRIDSLIGAGSVIRGDMSVEGGLRVDGQILGSITSAEGKPATLVLSESARVEGEIRVEHAVINGTVLGPVHASDYVELQGKANVTGDIHYRTLEIQLGAVLQGRLVYQGDADADKIVQFKPAAAD
jgi:cytoskeletal protein CcmA (bactofilin family)